MVNKMINTKPVSLYILFLFTSVSTSALADLTLRLEPEADDPGTHSMPARLGFASSNKGEGANTQFAISYNLTKNGNGDNLLYEPYVALVVSDNPATKTDKKSLEFGVKSVYGDVTQGTSWLIDANVAGSKDSIVGTRSIETKLSAEPVSTILKYGQGYTKNKWGVFVRPKIAVYHLYTLQTDDPALAPEGKAYGISVSLAVDVFPSFSDRTKFNFSTTHAHDLGASEARIKDNYKKHATQMEYSFYDTLNPPKGKALFSLVIDRSFGRDVLSASTDKKSMSGVYLGVKY